MLPRGCRQSQEVAQHWIPHGLAPEPMQRKAVYVDQTACCQASHEVVPVATTAHLRLVEVLFTHVIAAQHPVRCLRSDVQPLLAASSTQVSTYGNGHVSPLFLRSRTSVHGDR